MTGQPGRLREAIRRPLPPACHPLYRFYEGGSMTRAFRGLPEHPDGWRPEDWAGSCTWADNAWFCEAPKPRGGKVVATQNGG